MGAWFTREIADTGRLRLFCFFVAFIAGFLFIRFSVRMIRRQVRWWPGNVAPGGRHIHHVVFGLVFMCVGGIGGLAVTDDSSGWAAGAAALFGVGMALVLDEFALVFHLKDVYWSEQGRLSVEVVFVPPGRSLPEDAGLVILPGSKSTIGDLLFLREQGWDRDLQRHVRGGGHVVGICGGYQMLGKTVADPEGIEGPAGDTPGLGLLDVSTVMTPQKTLTRVSASHVATADILIHATVSETGLRTIPSPTSSSCNDLL